MNNTTTRREVTNHCSACGEQIANNSTEGCPAHPGAEVSSIVSDANAPEIEIDGDGTDGYTVTRDGITLARCPDLLLANRIAVEIKAAEHEHGVGSEASTVAARDAVRAKYAGGGDGECPEDCIS